MKDKKLIIFPRWFFPYNLGDSINFTIIPEIIKEHYDCEIEISTLGKDFIELLKLNNYGESALHEGVSIGMLGNSLQGHVNFAFSDDNTKDLPVKMIYPEMHPRLYPFWKEHQTILEDHPTANIITVNYLLQLGLEEYLFNGYDLREKINIPTTNHTSTSPYKIAIVPATKLDGKTSPHESCDGIGYRYKVEHWEVMVQQLREQFGEHIEIYEFSEKFLGLGDHHVKPGPPMLELARQVEKMDVGIMSDGGVHHVFNALNKPVVLFTGTLLNKSEFFKLKNSFYPEDIHLDCRFSCKSFFVEVLGNDDMSLSCKKECEDLDPVKLADYATTVIKNHC